AVAAQPAAAPTAARAPAAAATPAASPAPSAGVAATVQAPSAVAPAVTPVAPVAPAAPAPSPAPAAAPAPTPISAIQIPRADLDRALGDFSTLSQQLQVTAQPQGGFRLSQLQPGSFFARVGLRNDDVVLRVDGSPINGLDDAA